MAYDKNKLFEQAKKMIIQHNLYHIEDLCSFLPCSKSTFYYLFPHDPESNELNVLRRMLEDNKIKTKVEIRKKLAKSDKAAELLALYRLLATSDEHRRLNQNYTEVTGKDGGPLLPSIELKVRE